MCCVSLSCFSTSFLRILFIIACRSIATPLAIHSRILVSIIARRPKVHVLKCRRNVCRGARVAEIWPNAVRVLQGTGAMAPAREGHVPPANFPHKVPAPAQIVLRVRSHSRVPLFAHHAQVLSRCRSSTTRARSTSVSLESLPSQPHESVWTALRAGTSATQHMSVRNAPLTAMFLAKLAKAISVARLGVMHRA